jgi:hypothetical protein
MPEDRDLSCGSERRESRGEPRELKMEATQWFAVLLVLVLVPNLGDSGLDFN